LPAGIREPFLSYTATSLCETRCVGIDFISRGRHVRGTGFERDAEKGNAAVMAGWCVLHFTPRQVKSDMAVQAIEDLIRKRPETEE